MPLWVHLGGCQMRRAALVLTAAPLLWRRQRAAALLWLKAPWVSEQKGSFVTWLCLKIFNSCNVSAAQLARRASVQKATSCLPSRLCFESPVPSSECEIKSWFQRMRRVYLYFSSGGHIKQPAVRQRKWKKDEIDNWKCRWFYCFCDETVFCLCSFKASMLYCMLLLYFSACKSKMCFIKMSF